MRAGLILPAARASSWRSCMTLDFAFLSVFSPTRPACCSIPRYQGCSRLHASGMAVMAILESATLSKSMSCVMLKVKLYLA